MPHVHKRKVKDHVINCGNCHRLLAGFSAGLLVYRDGPFEVVAERVQSIGCACGYINPIDVPELTQSTVGPASESAA